MKTTFGPDLTTDRFSNLLNRLSPPPILRDGVHVQSMTVFDPLTERFITAQPHEPTRIPTICGMPIYVSSVIPKDEIWVAQDGVFVERFKVVDDRDWIRVRLGSDL